MRRFLFFAFILLVIGGAIFMIPENKVLRETNPYLPLYRIMELSNAEVVEGELHYWASLGEHPDILSLSQLEAEADRLFRRIVAEDGYIRKQKKDVVEAAYPSKSNPAPEDGFNPSCMVVEKEGQLGGTGALVHLLLQSMEVEGKDILYLLLTITEEGSTGQLSSFAQRVPTLLESEVENGSLSFCLKGYLEERLAGDDMEALANKIARELGEEGVQSVRDGAMVSITGYTPFLGDYFQAEDLRINFNMAMRYDEYLDKTVIWAGSPLIARWY